MTPSGDPKFELFSPFTSCETWQPYGVLNVYDFCQKCYNLWRWKYCCLWIIEKNIEKLGLLKTIEKLLKDIDIDWSINMKIFNYWTLLKDQYQILIIVLYCIELYWTQTQMLNFKDILFMLTIAAFLLKIKTAYSTKNRASLLVPM